MQYEKIENTLSISRFSTYRNAVIAANGVNCNTKSLSLYEWNANLSSAFLFPLHIYEVTLRNAISDAIASRYGNDWPTNQFFQNSLNYKNKKGLLSAIGSEYQGLGKVLPEIKLSWWEEMLKQVPPSVLSEDELEIYNFLESWAEEEYDFRVIKENHKGLTEEEQAKMSICNLIDNLVEKLGDIKQELQSDIEIE